MRKLKRGRKFHRKANQRKALLKSLASSLILKERIKTTEAKAREVKSFVEKAVSRAKKADLSCRRQLSRKLSQKPVKKLMEEIGPRYKDRKGGYTRIIKIQRRASDNSKMAMLEFIK
jgi:large subunit ribosomal protein L17